MLLRVPLCVPYVWSMSQQAGASRKGSHPDAFFQSRGWWWTWVRTSVGCCGHTSNQWPCQALPVPTVQRCQQTVEGGLAGQSWGRSPTCSLWCPQWTPGRWVGGQGLFSYCHASCSLTLAELAGEPISGAAEDRPTGAAFSPGVPWFLPGTPRHQCQYW